MSTLRQISNVRTSMRCVAYIVLAGMLACFPLLLCGVPLGSHDAKYHFVWNELYSSHFWRGNLLPDWLMHQNAGLGAPTFRYYGPLTYFFSSMLSPFFTTFEGIERQTYQLGLVSALLVIGSGITAFFWCSLQTDHVKATLTAILYMILPYHLPIDLTARFAFTELSAFVWMPGILYFVERIHQSVRPVHIAGLAVAYGTLICSNLAATVIFAVLPAAYSAYLGYCLKNGIRNVGLTILGMTLGVAIASFYLLPAMLEQSLVYLPPKTGWHSYSNWFLAPLTQSGKFAYILLLATSMMVFHGLVAWFIARHGCDPHSRRTRRFWLLVTVACVFMMTPASQPVYMLFKPLQLIQFPWRFNLLICISLIALTAQALSCLRSRVACISLVTIALMYVLLLAAVYFWAYQLAPPATKDNLELIKVRAVVGDYVPRWTSLWSLGDVDRIIDRLRSNKLVHERVLVEGDSGSAQILRWDEKGIVIGFSGKEPVRLVIGQLYFPTWVATSEREGDLTVEPTVEGLLSIAMSAGDKIVKLHMQDSNAQWKGKLISLGALIATISLVVFPVLLNRRTYEGRIRVL